MPMPRALPLLLPALLALTALAAAELPYDRTEDRVYLVEEGREFYMDVFVPNGRARHDYYQPTDHGQGLGIIAVASGSWHADRGKIRDQESAQVFNIMCARGYTVFAVRPGSRPHYDALEMARHVQRAIRYVKDNAGEWNIDPGRIGLMGASAGGHLALLAALTPPPRDSAGETLDIGVKAIGVFFPPTDFVQWRGLNYDGKIERIGDILFRGGVKDRDREEILARFEELSPYRRVRPGLPPTIFFHGTADPLVPLSQSEKMVEALRGAGNVSTLIIKPGGGHPWLDIPLDIIKLGQWFDHHLAGAPLPLELQPENGPESAAD